MATARVITNLKHDGTRYQSGDTVEASMAVLERLAVEGIVDSPVESTAVEEVTQPDQTDDDTTDEQLDQEEPAAVDQPDGEEASATVEPDVDEESSDQGDTSEASTNDVEPDQAAPAAPVTRTKPQTHRGSRQKS